MSLRRRQMDRAHGSAKKKEKVQRDQSSKVAGPRGHRIASASSCAAFTEAIAERAEAQADLGKTLGRGVIVAAPGPLADRTALARNLMRGVLAKAPDVQDVAIGAIQPEHVQHRLTVG